MIPHSLKSNLQFLVPHAWNNTHVLVSTKRPLKVYKKIIYYDKKDMERPRIIQLTIPKNALIVMPKYYNSKYFWLHKCRTNKAISHGQGFSYYNDNFKYEINKTMKPKKPFSRSLTTCESGIHFFFSKTQAKKYIF